MHALRRLLEKFHDAGVRYCHFKSNLHVDAAVEGKTDLDILIDRFHCQIASELLSQNGFKRFVPRLPSSYSAVEDWLGFDEDSGQLFHLHLHWQLIAGEPNLKGYRIPWEEDVLEHRIYDDASRIYIASPEIELLLLLVRASLKYRSRDVLRRLRGRPYPNPGSDILKEYKWLRERADRSILQSHTLRLLSPEIAELIDQLLDKDGFDHEVFNSIRKRVVQLFRSYRTYCPLQARTYRWFREVYSKVTQILNRKFGTLIVRRRIPATGGLIVALLGADGSGKSTQVKQLVKWLGWKLDVGYVYFGSGDGPATLPRRLLQLLGKAWYSFRVKRDNTRNEVNMDDQKSDLQKERSGILRKIYQGLLAVALAREKCLRIANAVRARNKGMIVVCDRFPQNQFPGYNDGPQLEAWLDFSRPWSFMAKIEQKLYRQLSSVSPDIVFKLHVVPETAVMRKPDTPLYMVEKKIAAIRTLTFHPYSKVVDVDAEQPLQMVELEIRKVIWNEL